MLVYAMSAGALLLAVMTRDLRLFTVRSGSMEPLIPTASVVAVAPAGELPYAAGDMITYQKGDGILVTHRVDSVESDSGKIMYRTKGDANDTIDAQPVQPSSVVGHVVLVIPLAGLLLAWVRTSLGFAVLILLPATFLILRELWILRRAWREFHGRRLVPAGAVAAVIIGLTMILTAAPSFGLFSDTAELSGSRVSVSDHLPRPSPSLEPSPSPRPSPTPEPSPSPRPSPTPEPTPTSSPTPEPRPSPEPCEFGEIEVEVRHENTGTDSTNTNEAALERRCREEVSSETNVDT